MKKLIFAVITGVLLALLFNRLFLNKNQNQGQNGNRGRGGMAAVAVETTPVKQDRLIDQALFSGSLIARSKFSVLPKISGRIRRLLADIGDEITNGQVIAELEDEELQLEVKQAQADIEIANANFNESASLLEIAKKELERTETMRKQKVSSDVDLEKAQAAFKTSQARHQVNRAQLSNRQSALESAKIRLSYTRVDASWTDGSKKRLIAEKFLDEGAMTGPNTPIASIIDIATMTAVIDVVEKDFFKIKIGQLAEIEAAAIPNCKFAGRVVRIAPILDSAARLGRVEIEISNIDLSLKPGMFVRARIIFEAHESATLVPNSSLVRRKNQTGIFLAETASMTAQFIPVEIGFSDSEYTEIASPTVSGEVVTLGHHLLQDGAPIKIAGKEEKPASKGKKGERK
ncbi:MAG: efflux RND transporter periplasmic adaptor subunit [Candidatus Rifleibacteriota bacterium]